MLRAFRHRLPGLPVPAAFVYAPRMDVLIDAVPVLAVGGFLWCRLARLDRRLGSVERGLDDVAQGLARLEGRFEGWQNGQRPPVTSG